MWRDIKTYQVTGRAAGEGRDWEAPNQSCSSSFPPRSCLDNLFSSSQSNLPQHCSTNRECSQCPGQAPSTRSSYSHPALHNNFIPRERCKSFLCQEDTHSPTAREKHCPPSYDHFRKWVYQIQYYISSSGHTWKSTNKQHKATYQTFPWLHSPRLKVFLVQERS